MKRFVAALLLCSYFALSIHAQTESFWTTSSVPSNTIGNDNSSVELGLRFSSNVAGSVTGARVYCATNSSGTHTVHLWNSKGVSLSTATAPACTGWTAVNFASPIAITAGSTYTISYHTTEYPWNTGFFGAAVANGSNLTAPANAGVFVYGSKPAYPSSTWETSNYWVDVLFTTTPVTAPPTYAISGTISGAGSENVAVSGASSANTVASSSGAYTFTGLANGTYTVTPTLSGYTLSPTSQSVTVSGANATLPAFIATKTATPTYTISGTITGAGSEAVALTGAASANAVASNSGAYSFAGLANGSYTVTPSLTGYTLSPTSQSVTVSGANVSVPAFTATAIPTYTISGSISGAGGETVALSGAASASTAAGSAGAYSFAGLANGSYTVTPTQSGYTFTPTSENITLSGANATVPTFAATAVGYSITGTITPSTLGSGVAVNLSGTAQATTTATSSGTFTFTGLANGSYTLTPTSSSASFSPTSENLTVNGGNATAPTFTATATATVIFYDAFSGTTLSPAWVAMSRHGDYSNNELECYLPANVAVNNLLTITTVYQTYTCGDAYTSPASWPYTSGMIQWQSFNFTYGTVEFRAIFPSASAVTWPAVWMLGSNCQAGNIVSADNTGSCNWPAPGSQEIDIAEFVDGQQGMFTEAGGHQYCEPNINAAEWHTYDLIWSSSSLIYEVDGVTTCSITTNVPNTPMFLMINDAVPSTASGGNGLPAALQVEYVKVTQP